MARGPHPLPHVPAHLARGGRAAGPAWGLMIGPKLGSEPLRSHGQEAADKLTGLSAPTAY